MPRTTGTYEIISVGGENVQAFMPLTMVTT
jgi:hypothetical protein